jgi:long-chain acyl-CoA synthetase
MARQLERFDNLVSLFLTRAEEKGGHPFLWAKRDGEWRSISWAEAARQVTALAASFKRIGLQRGDRVALVSENRPEWLIADLGIMAAGCVTVPTYTTNTTRDHSHILENSGARAVIVSNHKLARNLIPAVITSNECHHVIGMEPLGSGQAPEWVNCHSWTKLVSGEADIAQLREQVASVDRADLACLIYTSGTGGAPRGVQQHHGAILHNLEG